MKSILLSILILIILVSDINGQYNWPNWNDSPNPLSIGGSYTTPGECPWLCPLFMRLSRKNVQYICGSSLVSSQYVVTAAHCVRPKQTTETTDPSLLQVYMGVYALDDETDPNVVVIEVAEVKVSPKWDATEDRYEADVALLKLKEPASFNKYVQRISLPTTSYIQNNINGMVVGYGKSENEQIHELKPRKIKIPVVDAEECYQSHHVFAYLKGRDAFCAGKSGVIPCNGDSGSSFYLIEKSSPVLIGIVSSGIKTQDGKCKENAFALFSDVFKHVEWIKKVVGSGYLLANQGSVNIDTRMWKSNDGFCEYVIDDGYRCDLRGIRSSTNDVKVTTVNGQHRDGRDDDEVGKLWIVEQEAKYIPELSDVVEKFKRISDLRIWSSGLKFIERSKLVPFAKRLRVLDFFNNHIEEIPADAFNDLTQLQELKILNNRIKNLPENLFKNLNNLKWFFAEFNEIEELPEHLFDPTQIVVVSMKNNKLRKISVDFRDLRNVNVIDFNQNVCIDKCLGHYCSKISVSDMQSEIDQKCR